MDILDGVLRFKSLYEWYVLERDGSKPNTVRLLTRDEYTWLWDRYLRGQFNRVAIQCVNPPTISVNAEPKEFVRDIVWAGKLDDLLGQVLFMVCWKGKPC